MKSAIVTTLLRRANPQDFPTEQGHSLANVAWLINNVPTTASGLVPAFLDALCTKKWLGRQFTYTACGLLAKGVRLLALQQPPHVRQRFQNPSLGIRLQTELSRFTQVAPEEQGQIIQLLGCAALCGLFAKGCWFKNVPLSTIAALPLDTVPHRVDARKVEDWQFQLWLGLRVVTSVTGKPLAEPPALIVHTLGLWRVNLTESVLNPASAGHRVNQSMTTWLESCARGNQGLLLPARPI